MWSGWSREKLSVHTQTNCNILENNSASSRHMDVNDIKILSY